MTKQENPFLISGYINPSYFCDREEETRRVTSALQNGRNLTLVSIRRLGKTGLIKNVFYHLQDTPYRLLYLDILPTTSMQDFIRLFGNAIIADEKKHSTTGTPQEAELSMRQIFDYIASQKAQYIIAIDEFQQITYYPEKNVEAILRTYIQPLTNANFIFSGSNKHILSSMFSDYGRPFYQSTDFLYLKRLKKEVYADFIYERLSGHKFIISKDDINDIIDYYDTYTFYIQTFFNRLFATGIKKIDRPLIEETKGIILEEREYVFYNYRNLLTNSQFNLLKAIALEGTVEQPGSKDFMIKHGLAQPSSISRSLNALISKEMIYREDSAYKVYDVFFSKWLSK